MLRWITLVIFAFLFWSPITVMQARTTGASSYRMVGYYTSWAMYGRQYFVTDIPAAQLTHINYAFANISETGDVVLGDEWADVQFPYPTDVDSDPLKGNFHQFQVLKEAHPHLQTLISIGGWTWSGRFSDVALTPEARAHFAQSAVSFMIEYGFDGIDLDWEYPTGNGLATNVVRPQDPENFILLLAELRAQLTAQSELDGGRPYMLTIAASANRTSYESLDWERIHPLLDWINVMTYDMSGGWSTKTSFAAPLYPSPNSPEGSTSVDETLQGFLREDIPSNKIVMGVPFYGTGWTVGSSENNGLFQAVTGLASGTWEPGSLEYEDIATNHLSKFERFWDEDAQAVWLYDAENQIVITYDDPETMALKANYVRDHALGGIMFWELSQDDAQNTLMTTLYDTLNAP